MKLTNLYNRKITLIKKLMKLFMPEFVIDKQFEQPEKFRELEDHCSSRRFPDRQSEKIKFP